MKNRRRNKIKFFNLCENLECRALLSTLASRWSSTITDGGNLGQGDATTVTWSIVPDGTIIRATYSSYGEVESPSNLVSYLNTSFGVVTNDTNYTDEVWFSYFDNMFEKWDELGGLNFEYVSYDDGARLGFGGELGVRADVRIGGHRIDGPSSILAYNWYPNNGDMVIDTTESFSLSNVSKFNAAIGHEAGHGLGLQHVTSNNSVILMEPVVNASLNGQPQFDDIYGLQRHYGDVNEENGGNNTLATATLLGNISTVSIGTSAKTTVVTANQTDFLSIDDETDVDMFSFSVPAGMLNITLTPIGPTYSVGPQGGSESTFNAAQQNDLVLQLIDSNGNVVASSNVGTFGGIETLSNSVAAGTYYARITGTTIDKLQFYQLDVSVTPTPALSIVVERKNIYENDTYQMRGSVMRVGDLTSDLIVTLTTDNTEISIPQTVTILAGQSYVDFPVYAVDDLLVDGTQTVYLTASAAGFLTGSVSINVLDNEVALPTLSIAFRKTTILENSGTNIALGTVTRTGDLSKPLIVYLNSDNDKVLVQSYVIIPAGSNYVPFNVTVKDNNIKDGNQTITISAFVDGFQLAQSSLVVKDNERKGASLVINNSLIDNIFSNFNKEYNHYLI